MGAWFEDVGLSWLILVVFFAGAGASLWTGSFIWMTLSLVICGLVFLWLYAREH